jgi:RNA polymerase sigma-70 factor (ECF subfamily)
MQNRFENLDDIKLVKLAKKGDKKAFEELVCRYQDKVYNIALRYLNNNSDDAIDVSQDVFITTYKNLKSFRGQSLFSTWLYRVTVNKCIDFIKKRKTIKSGYPFEQKTRKDEKVQAFEPGVNDPPAEKVDQEMRRKYLYQALWQLDERQRQIIILKDIQGLKYKQICEIFNVSTYIARTWLTEARTALKEKLENISSFFRSYSSK